MHRWFIGIAVLAGCGNTESEPPWEAVSEDRASALLSVWGSSADDVWIVGGDEGGAGPIVLHYDGTGFTKLESGLRNVDLWWVYGFAGGPIFMSGSNGTIVRYENGAFVTLPTPGTLTIYGMWGAAPDDVWAVGGAQDGGGFAWHFDGTAWTEASGLPADIADGTLFKVNGLATDDVWMVGTTGTTLHWNGSTFERMDVPTDATLLSVAGNTERFISVGGNFDGVLFENTGDGWVSALATGGPRLTGVAVSATDAYAVGEFGSILQRSGGAWAIEQPRVTNEDLHAAWIDPDGNVWAVGGDFESVPTGAGVLLHKGQPLQGSIP